MTVSQRDGEDSRSAMPAQLPESWRQRMEITVVQVIATSAVQQVLSFGYRRLTGRDEPTARDADVPLRRILLWAAASAASVAMANVVVDRWVLRPRGTAERRPDLAWNPGDRRDRPEDALAP